MLQQRLALRSHVPAATVARRVRQQRRLVSTLAHGTNIACTSRRNCCTNTVNCCILVARQYSTLLGHPFLCRKPADYTHLSPQVLDLQCFCFCDCITAS
jgi:hypothetical protein